MLLVEAGLFGFTSIFCVDVLLDLYICKELWSPRWTSSTLSRHFEQITLSFDWSQTIQKDLPGTKICLTRLPCWGRTTNVPVLYYHFLYYYLSLNFFFSFYCFVEVKLQTFPHLYRGTFHCFTNTWRTEGVTRTSFTQPFLRSSLFILSKYHLCSSFSHLFRILSLFILISLLTTVPT